MIPSELRPLVDDFFNHHAHEYDMTENSGCGQYMEALVPFCQSHGFPKVGHLKKTGGATQYNGHANDAFLYADGEGNPDSLFQAVDVIANAESKPPYTPSHQPPAKGWSVDIPRYTADDWLKEPDNGNGNGNTNPNMVPWVTYNEQGFERLKKMLKHDYERRPQGPDYDVSAWAGRFFHNCYMGPERIPLGEDAALSRVKGELCNALGISNDGYLGT